MTEQVKKNAKALSKDTKTAIRNFIRLVESAALLVVSVFAIYGAYHYNVAHALFVTLVVAGVIIGLRGSSEFLKYLAQK